jgi:hypothetical protein
MDADRSRLAQRHQARHGVERIAVLHRHDLAVIVRRDATHVVVAGRQDRDRLAGHVDAGEDARGFGDARQALVDDLRVEMLDVQLDVVLVRATAAAFANLDGHRAGNDVTRGEVLGRGRIALHEALAVAVGDVAALAAHALGDQAARAVDAGRMKLHELEVLQRQTGAQRHGAAVTGAGVGRGRRLVDAAVTAGRQHRTMGAEAMDRAVVEVPGHNAAAHALVHDQVEREVLDEELGVVTQRLLVERVQDGVAGTVGRRAGALGDALAVLGGHAAERALVDLALGRAAERHAEMLELDDRRDAVAAHVFDRVLVAEPVGTLDCVVHVPAPVVGAHVAERRRDAALRRHGVAAGREHLGDAGRFVALVGHAEGGAQARSAGADHDHVVLMVDHGVGAAADVESAGARAIALAVAAVRHV